MKNWNKICNVLMTRSGICILMFLTMLISFSCYTTVTTLGSDNILGNPGFEEPGSEGLPKGWNILPAYKGKGQAFMDLKNMQTGKSSLRIKPNMKNTKAAFGVYRQINPDSVKGREITISGFAKVLGIGNNNAGILFKTEKENWLVLPKDTEGKFVFFSKTFKVAGSIPEANIMLLISGTEGDIWFDDLRVYDASNTFSKENEENKSKTQSVDISNNIKAIKRKVKLGDLPASAALLFVSNRDTGGNLTEIYAADSDGGNVTRLTFTDGCHFIMGMDRSRRYIITSRVERDTEKPKGLGYEDSKALYLLDLKTKEESRLTDPQNHAEGRSFSPDGEWIVFLMKIHGENQVDIYKIRRDGTDLTNLTNTPNATEGDVAWSNHGNAIVYTYLDEQKNRFLLKTMDSNGGNIKTLYDGGPGVSTRVFPPGNYDPAWSPDDQWVVFERSTKSDGGNWGSGIWHIFKVRSDGSEVVDLSISGKHSNRAEYLPSFSPDGECVTFGSMYEAKDPKESHNGIFVMDCDGGNLKQICDAENDKDMYPVWIP